MVYNYLIYFMNLLKKKKKKTESGKDYCGSVGANIGPRSRNSSKSGRG